MKSDPAHDCVICHHLRKPGSGAVSLIGLHTAIEGIICAANRRLNDGPKGTPHVMAHVCAEHVIDVYRGRVPGVAMAWRAATPA